MNTTNDSTITGSTTSRGGSTNANPSPQKEQKDLINRIENTLTKQFRVTRGTDTDGETYDSIEEMWYSEGILLHKRQNKKSSTTTPTSSPSSTGTLGWYRKSHDYWQNDGNAPATIDGMLGGFAILTEKDLEGSRAFVEDLFQRRRRRPVTTATRSNIDHGTTTKSTLVSSSSSSWTLKERLEQGKEEEDKQNSDDHADGEVRKTRCCECGSGIGRVSKGLLLPLGFQQCDLIETSPRLINAAPDYIGDPDASLRCRFICKGLQDFEPLPDTYDIIWIQWVIGYLTDWDLVQFLKRMGQALRRTCSGVIIIKDNVCEDNAFLLDKDDCSIARSLSYLLALVKESGLRVVQLQEEGGKIEDTIRYQEGFPDSIFPVPMIALELDDDS